MLRKPAPGQAKFWGLPFLSQEFSPRGVWQSRSRPRMVSGSFPKPGGRFRLLHTLYSFSPAGLGAAGLLPGMPQPGSKDWLQCSQTLPSLNLWPKR